MKSAPDFDWEALARLRDAFLRGTAGQEDYWKSEADLSAYDATFAQRIGWKWDFVLEDLRRLGWTPPAGELVDWGCGSGIAARACLDHFGTGAFSGVRFFDRSPAAMEFATRRAGSRFPGLQVSSGAPSPDTPPGTVLISHLLTELDPSQTEQLLERIQGATAVIWVEPGTYEASLALIAVRERLRERLNCIAPCTHRGRCGILAQGNDPHWCHHFASPPPGVFTDPFWGRFANLLGIDLRSLPLSYLVLDRRNSAEIAAETVRVIGRPRIHKADLRVLACATDGSVAEHSLFKRHLPEAYRDAKKDRFASLQRWIREDGRVVAAVHSETSNSEQPPPE